MKITQLRNSPFSKWQFFFTALYESEIYAEFLFVVLPSKGSHHQQSHYLKRGQPEMIPSGSPLDALIILHVSSTHFLLVPQFFITGHFSLNLSQLTPRSRS